MNVYGDPATEQWFRKAWQASGKKLDMGKSCVRFKKLEDAPLDVIGHTRDPLPVFRSQHRAGVLSRSLFRHTYRNLLRRKQAQVNSSKM